MKVDTLGIGVNDLILGRADETESLTATDVSLSQASDDEWTSPYNRLPRNELMQWIARNMPFVSAVIQQSQTDEHELELSKLKLSMTLYNVDVVSILITRGFHIARGKTCVDQLFFMSFYCPPAFLPLVASLLLR